MRLSIIGVGLMGGSLGKALVRGGHDVTGFDADQGRLRAAVAGGVVSRAATSLAHAAIGHDIVFVGVPVSSVPGVVIEALDAGASVVTDVGSVKASVVEAVERARPETAPRFVGGHPMAGSEQEGLEGADPDLFSGATWVLTPTTNTDPTAFTAVQGVIRSLGAEVVAVDPTDHDALVATVSHVPHLAAGTLMLLAAEQAGSTDRGPLLRLAAGGFRDMTRIAAGHPGIWPDICVENRDAIVRALDEYVRALTEIRDRVAGEDRDGLLAALERARDARTNLPIAGLEEGPFVELRIPVPDRPGVLAEVTTLAGQLGVNIVDLEIAHSAEGPEGVLVLIVPTGGVEGFEAALEAAAYRVSKRAIE